MFSPKIITYVMLFIAIIFIICNTNSHIHESFDPTKQNNNITITLYHANWCGFCKMFLPEWNAFEEYAKANISNITVNTILCEGDNEKKCEHLKGFPTVILHKNNESILYTGQRTKDDLIKFVKSN